MNYTWSVKNQFQTEFDNFPEDQQDKIIEFTDLYEVHGLNDFDVYEGKIAPSWSGADIDPDVHEYAKSNELWHYHIGIPEYREVHSKYKTSEWALHFQWPNKGNHIILVDLYTHYLSDGTYYLPPESSL